MLFIRDAQNMDLTEYEYITSKQSSIQRYSTEILALNKIAEIDVINDKYNMLAILFMLVLYITSNSSRIIYFFIVLDCA